MAKSFKQPTVKAEASKPASEKDFLSFLEEEREEVATGTPLDKVQESRSDQNVTDDTSVTDVVKATKSETEEDKLATRENLDVDVRQTFIVSEHYLEQLKNYVHTRRIAGEYEYTQKQALHEALDKLFAGFELVSRPAHIRQQEEKRKQKIRKGRGA